jgi:acetoin utilization protein AcuB
MFVGERMSRPVITVSPETPVHDALVMFKKEHIRRAPVIKNGKLLGIVTENNLINASASPATTLSVWEINYLISKVTVKQVMTKKVKCIDADTPIEEAARIMTDLEIGGMPVTRAGKIVGMITETDLFKVFLELMGAREKGVRVSALVEDKPGQLARISKAITEAGGNFIAFGVFSGPDTSVKLVTFKVAGMKKDDVKKVLEKVIKKFVDVRQS